MLFGSIPLGCFLLKMLENLLDYLRIFDTGNDFDLTAAVFADFDVDVEDALESLHPGHSAMPLCRTLVVPVDIGRFWWIGLFAAFGRCDLNPVFAVRREYAMKPCQINSRLGYQRSQFGHEVQRLKDHMGGAIAGF